MLRPASATIVSLCLIACSPQPPTPPETTPSVVPTPPTPSSQGPEGGTVTDEAPANPGSGAAELAAADDERPPVESGSEQQEAEGAVDTFEEGIYTSHAFNVRFELPSDWDLVDSRMEAMEERPPREGQLLPNPPSWFEAADGMRMPVQLGGDGPLGLRRSYDSLTFVGPPESGIYMVVSGRDSVALGVANFQTLDERVGLSDVSLYEDRSGARTLDGVGAYFVEGTARDTTAQVPISFQSMSLDIPSGPVNITILIPQEKYAQCPTPTAACLPDQYSSAVMQRVLESMEIVDRGRE
jgi:hypothetical protein